MFKSRGFGLKGTKKAKRQEKRRRKSLSPKQKIKDRKKTESVWRLQHGK